jgi:hypothetical protein
MSDTPSSFPGSLTDFSAAIAQIKALQAEAKVVYDQLDRIQAAASTNEKIDTDTYFGYRAISQFGFPMAYFTSQESALERYANAVKFDREIQASAGVFRQRLHDWLENAVGNLHIAPPALPTLTPDLAGFLTSLPPA